MGIFHVYFIRFLLFVQFKLWLLELDGLEAPIGNLWLLLYPSTYSIWPALVWIPGIVVLSCCVASFSGRGASNPELINLNLLPFFLLFSPYLLLTTALILDLKTIPRTPLSPFLSFPTLIDPIERQLSLSRSQLGHSLPILHLIKLNNFIRWGPRVEAVLVRGVNGADEGET